MKLITFSGGTVTLELDPTDCLALSEACDAAIRHDAHRNFTVTSTLRALFGLAAAVGAATGHINEGEDFTMPKIAEAWQPKDDRWVH